MIYWHWKILLIISLTFIYINVEAIQCKRGKSCGNACIAIDKTCHKLIIYSWRDLKTGTLYISSKKPEWYKNPKWPIFRPFAETEIILFK